MASKRRRRAKRPAYKTRFREVAGKAVLVVVVLAASAVPAVFVASPITYVPPIAVAACLMMSLIYLLIVSRCVHFSEGSTVASCERGTAAEFVVTFRNASILPVVRLEPWFYISDLFGGLAVDVPQTLTLMPREEREFRFQATFDHIGTYSAGLSRLRIGDALGLFHRTRANGQRHFVQVLPRVFSLEQLELSNISVQESRRAYQSIVTDDMDYAGVRSYAWGDPIKTIHWKLSARNADGSYLTRLFETFGNPSLSIVLDHTAPAYDGESLMEVFDGLVESALSVGAFSRERGMDTLLMYQDKHGETVSIPVPDVRESQALIEDIPRVVVANEGRAALDILGREVRSVHGAGNIAVCTAHVSEEMVTLLTEAKLRDRNPLLFLVVPTCLEGRERDEFLRPLRRLGASSVSCYVISDTGQVRR